jgi:hypothetical protein
MPRAGSAHALVTDPAGAEIMRVPVAWLTREALRD